MCGVIAIRHVEDCFDGDFIKEFELDCAAGRGGHVSFGRGRGAGIPSRVSTALFSHRQRGRYTIQGVIGKTTFRVTFSRSTSEEAINALNLRFRKEKRMGAKLTAYYAVGQGTERGAAGSDAAGDEDAHAG